MIPHKQSRHNIVGHLSRILMQNNHAPMFYILNRHETLVLVYNL